MESFYLPLYANFMMLFSLLYTIKLYDMRNSVVLYGPKNKTPITVFCIFYILLLGLRPTHSLLFGDTINYTEFYENMSWSYYSVNIKEKDWLFTYLMYLCTRVTDLEVFFLVVECVYVGTLMWFCKILFKNNYSLALLFCITAFSFYSYSVNGIRNGMACHLLLPAMGLWLTDQKKNWAILIFVCAFFIHNSTALPILCFFIALYFRFPKTYLYIWLAAIVLSFLLGSTTEKLFMGLNFDDRLDRYINREGEDIEIYKTGFRIDFLLYSSMPVLLGVYVIFKRKIKDAIYSTLLSTYLLTSIFWVLMIHAPYSNRFAYLSWFMYPVILAYPLLKFPLWKRQGFMTGLILSAQAGFTYLMWLIGKL